MSFNINPAGSLENALMGDLSQKISQGQSGASVNQEMQLLETLMNSQNTQGCEGHHHHGREARLERALENDLTQKLQQGQTPNGNEMQLLTELLQQNNNPFSSFGSIGSNPFAESY